MRSQVFRKYPLSYYLIAVIFIILVGAVAAMIGITYLAMEETFRANAQSVQLQTENNLVAVFRSKEEGIRIFEESLNKRMEEAFPPFLAEYERAGGDPARMDLEAVKTELGGEMELYVIDENATIIATTYTPELGLRFGDFAPYFADYLSNIRQTGEFHPDRIVSEKSTGAMKKFAYLPTPDHRYILELGLPVLVPNIASFRFMDEDLLMQVEHDNPYLEEIRIFDTTLRQRVNDTSVEIDDPVLKEILSGVLANRSTLEITDPQSGTLTRYLFVELGDDAFGSDVSRIIRITYTDQPVRDVLASGTRFYLSVGFIALVICSLLAIIAIRRLTRPIGEMVDDIDIIASGDMDHPLSPSIGAELIQLEESISTMIARLKDHIRQHQMSEKRFMDLVQLLPQGVFETDLDGNVTFANAKALAIFQFTQEDIRKGISVYDVVAPQDRSLARERFRTIWLGEKSEGTEITCIRKDGSTFPVMAYVTLIIENATPIGFRGGFVDITQLKTIEAEIRNLNRELEQRVADRTRQLVEVNRNLESFTYSVSHDLRAPLRAISGFSSILLHDLQDIPETDSKYLKLIQQNANNMGQLIDDLLGFSRLGQYSLQKKTIFPATIFHEVIQDLQTETNLSKVEFRVGDLPLCKADPVLMRLVVANLLSNAIKFSRPREHPVVEIGSLREDGKQVYFVRDNGIGFDMRYANKIFGVFERLHSTEEYEGTGVGLAIVHRVIELHGGKIWAESEVDKGSTFYFTCD